MPQSLRANQIRKMGRMGLGRWKPDVVEQVVVGAEERTASLFHFVPSVRWSTVMMRGRRRYARCASSLSFPFGEERRITRRLSLSMHGKCVRALCFDPNGERPWLTRREGCPLKRVRIPRGRAA